MKDKDRELRGILEELWDKAYSSKYVRDFYGVEKTQSQIKALYKPLGKEELEGLANDIELKVMAEITDRRGFRQEWDCMDKDIQNEIEETLIDIISQAIINARGEKLDAK